MPHLAAMWVDRAGRSGEVAPVHAPTKSPDSHAFVPDSGQAWVRLVVAVLIASIGAVGMWSIVVVMPTVQAEFATTRGAISLATTMIFMGFGLGGVIMGRITDKVGIVAAMAVSIVLLTIAY